MHHGASMRLTITLDDDLYAMARAHAVARHVSISKAIADLLRRQIVKVDPAGPSFYIDPVTQLPVVRGRTEKVTVTDVQRVDEDEDLRHLEVARGHETRPK